MPGRSSPRQHTGNLGPQPLLSVYSGREPATKELVTIIALLSGMLTLSVAARADGVIEWGHIGDPGNANEWVDGRDETACPSGRTVCWLLIRERRQSSSG